MVCEGRGEGRGGAWRVREKGKGGEVCVLCEGRGGNMCKQGRKGEGRGRGGVWCVKGEEGRCVVSEERGEREVCGE